MVVTVPRSLLARNKITVSASLFSANSSARVHSHPSQACKWQSRLDMDDLSLFSVSKIVYRELLHLSVTVSHFSNSCRSS